MRKDTKMDAHVTRSGYRYYTPTQKKSEVTKLEEEKKWKKRLTLARKSHLVRNKEPTESDCESCRFDGCDSTHVSPLYL